MTLFFETPKARTISTWRHATLADQLGGKHLKRAVVVLGVLKHRLNAAEVYPLAIFAHDADQVVDARGTVGDQR